MNNEIFSWIIVAEIALPLLILSVVLGWALFSNYKKNKEAARNLILKIKNNEENEKEALLSFLKEKIALEEEKAKKVTKKIINERKFLFRNLISGLLDKNMEAIAALESDMSRITRHYHQLEVQAAPPAEDEGESEADSETIEELRQEIKSLKHEIHITLTTLNNIFAEFSSMFGEEVPETEMSVDQIITAMESFSNKGETSDSVEETDDRLAAIDEIDDEPDAFAEVEDAIDEIAAETEEPSTMEEAEAVKTPEAEEEPEAEPEAEPQAEIAEEATEINQETEVKEESESLDFSLDDELDDIDSALDELELGASENDEPSWDEAFEESGDKPSEN